MSHLPRSLQTAVSTVTIIATIFALVAGFIQINLAEAATLTPFRFELGSSKPNTATNVAFTFTNVTALSGDTTAGEDDGKIVIRFPDSTAANTFFTLGAIDTDIGAGGFADTSISGFPAGITINSIAISDRGTTNQNDTITIGLNQTDGASAAINISGSTANLAVNFLNNKITTPSKVSASGTADIHQVSIATRANGASVDLDNAGSQVAVVEATAGSATVNTTLTFSVAAIAGSTSVHGISTDVASTATTIPFGTLAPNAAKEVAQRLSIVTNAPNGYNLYVVQNNNLTAGGNDIDSFKDGARVDETDSGGDVAWTQPLVVASSEATYGHLGYGTTDTEVFTSNQYAGIPSRVDASAPVVTGLACNNTTQTAGDTCDIVYKVEISALQEAGSYTNEITYVLVPLY